MRRRIDYKIQNRNTQKPDSSSRKTIIQLSLFIFFCILFIIASYFLLNSILGPTNIEQSDNSSVNNNSNNASLNITTNNANSDFVSSTTPSKLHLDTDIPVFFALTKENSNKLDCILLMELSLKKNLLYLSYLPSNLKIKNFPTLENVFQRNGLSTLNKLINTSLKTNYTGILINSKTLNLLSRLDKGIPIYIKSNKMRKYFGFKVNKGKLFYNLTKGNIIKYIHSAKNETMKTNRLIFTWVNWILSKENLASIIFSDKSNLQLIEENKEISDKLEYFFVGLRNLTLTNFRVLYPEIKNIKDIYNIINVNNISSYFNKLKADSEKFLYKFRKKIRVMIDNRSDYSIDTDKLEDYLEKYNIEIVFYLDRKSRNKGRDYSIIISNCSNLNYIIYLSWLFQIPHVFDQAYIKDDTIDGIIQIGNNFELTNIPD